MATIPLLIRRIRPEAGVVRAVRWGAIGLLLSVLAVGCSSGSKRAAPSLTTKPAATTATTQATTTTSEATTTEPATLQDRVIPPPAGYSFAGSLGDPNNPDSAGGVSSDIVPSDFNDLLGVPNAATTLHFQQGYTQFYHYDASPPNSTVRALEIDLFEFDGASDANAFVQQAADRAVALGGDTTKSATTVSGAPAISINAGQADPDGVYDHGLVAANGTRAMQLLYADATAGPSSFLGTIAVSQYPRLQSITAPTQA